MPVLVFVALLLCLACPARADDLDDARKLLLTGQYSAAVAAAEKGAKEEEGSEDWRILLVQAHMA
ncbi:MAG: hypothetical protein EB141_10020, partial [Verrucomicrobia bacterium]|nr:hypothetical protein [Verrucomicrobiota bacterium]